MFRSLKKLKRLDIDEGLQKEKICQKVKKYVKNCTLPKTGVNLIKVIIFKVCIIGSGSEPPQNKKEEKKRR